MINGDTQENNTSIELTSSIKFANKMLTFF
mgnify:CR=1 FL=1|jgi:hypothetical protein